jgi:hypothetical protein
MKNYHIISDGITFRVNRIYFGLIPVTVKENNKPLEFLSLDQALTYVASIAPKRRIKRKWNVVCVWNRSKRIL